MQPVLVLAPQPTPLPEVVAATTASPVGAFLAAFEAQRPDAALADETSGLPVLPAMPVLLVLVPPVDAETLAEGIGPAVPRAESVIGTEVPGGDWVPQAGREVAATGGEALVLSAGRVAGKAGEGVQERTRAVIAGEGDPAVPTTWGSEQGPDDEAGIADAVRAVTQSRADGWRFAVQVSGVVRGAVVERTETRDPAVTVVDGEPSPFGPGRLERATGEGGTSVPFALPAPFAGGQKVSPAGSKAEEAVPQATGEPEAPGRAPAGSERLGAETGAPAMATASAVEVPDGHGRMPDDGPVPELSPGRPEIEGDGAVVDLDERKVLEAPVRPGLWESMFSSLVLPEAAVKEVTRTLWPLVTTGTDASTLLAPPGLAEAVRTLPDHPPYDRVRPQARELEAALPKPETAKVAGPLPAPAAALWAPEPLWLTPTAEFEKEPVSERLQLPFAPGPLTTGGAPSVPAAAAATQSTPVAPLAAQLTAALSCSANGATELALSPDELGHVRLRLEPDAANPERMVVMMTFERPETLDLFRRHAGELAEALRAAGYAGADIGFGQDRSGSGGSDRSGDPAADWGIGQQTPEAAALPSPAPRLAAGASLDLRL